MFCENCGAELQDSNQKFCPSCGTPLRKIEGDVHLNEKLDSDEILLFVDHKRYRIWMWHGKNIPTRSKFFVAKQTSNIRDRFGPNFKIVAVDEGNEPSEFKEVEIQHKLKLKDLYRKQYSNFKSKKPKKRVKKRLTSYDGTFKIMMLGDADTPKTSLIFKYISGFYLKDLKLTIGVDFYSKTTLYKGKKIKLQIWDFGGEERFRFLLHQYCKGANAALFLYNITNPSTLEHLPDWIQIIREHSGDIPIILVGAKAHLEQSRAVSKEEGILAAQKYNLSGFIEVSSKTGKNVKEAFELILAILLEKITIITGIK